MKATIKTQNTANARQLDKKELVHTLKLICHDSTGKLFTACDARFYMSRSGDGASPVYCALWARSDKHYGSGAGVAKGYGYHKNSAAMDSAITSAGFELDKHIDGCGSDAMREALLALAEAVGVDLSLGYLFV